MSRRLLTHGALPICRVGLAIGRCWRCRRSAASDAWRRQTARRRCTGPCTATTTRPGRAADQGGRQRRTRRTSSARRRCPRPRSPATPTIIETAAEGRRRSEFAGRRRADSADGDRARTTNVRRRGCCSTTAPTSTPCETQRKQTALMWAAAQSQAGDGEGADRARRRRRTPMSLVND